MARLIAGMASSHAATLDDPRGWDDHRRRNREGYQRRYGVLPPEQPQIASETEDDTRARYSRIRDGLSFVQRKLGETRPDTLIMVGDDQNENFTEANLPQIAIFVGDSFLVRSRDPGQEPVRVRSNPGLAEAILEGSVASGVDMASVRSLPNETLLAHAFGPVLRTVDPAFEVPVVPIFVNAIHVPAPSPRRCYAYGETIRVAVEQYSRHERVALYASGGMSHFTAGYPWKRYQGPFSYGAISESFDRELFGIMEAGEGHRLGELTDQQIIGNGEIELRSWITIHGAMGDVRPELLVYEPFYRAIMAMGVGYWDLSAN